MQIAGYARKSTNPKSVSLEDQTATNESWAAENCSDACYLGTFVDDPAERVSIFMRQAGQQLLVILNPGDMIVVANYERCFRSPREIEKTFDTCLEAGLTLHLLDMPFDLSDADDRKKCYAIFRSETTRDAKAIRARNGLSHTRAPIGWKVKVRQGKKQYVPDIDARKLAVTAEQLIKQELPRREVYERLAPHHKHFGLKKMYDATMLRKMACYAHAGFPLAYLGELRAAVPCFNSLEFLFSPEEIQVNFRQQIAAMLERRRLQENGRDQRGRGSILRLTCVVASESDSCARSNRTARLHPAERRKASA